MKEISSIRVKVDISACSEFARVSTTQFHIKAGAVEDFAAMKFTHCLEVSTTVKLFKSCI